ncbi:hypothetical protein VP01_4185g1 [Puccinia sorghi]|uniref:Uncharacterized protein n=1 Tax=Puccinia sorghi TaxID=27349 RepID=A0A0L6UQU4_9BASI|nr:hypothetical protein VP01_4185g1 [Puccinia sorghi]
MRLSPRPLPFMWRSCGQANRVSPLNPSLKHPHLRHLHLPRKLSQTVCLPLDGLDQKLSVSIHAPQNQPRKPVAISSDFDLPASSPFSLALNSPAPNPASPVLESLSSEIVKITLLPLRSPSPTAPSVIASSPEVRLAVQYPSPPPWCRSERAKKAPDCYGQWSKSAMAAKEYANLESCSPSSQAKNYQIEMGVQDKMLPRSFYSEAQGMTCRHGLLTPCQIQCQNMPSDMQLNCVLLWRYSILLKILCHLFIMCSCAIQPCSSTTQTCSVAADQCLPGLIFSIIFPRRMGGGGYLHTSNSFLGEEGCMGMVILQACSRPVKHWDPEGCVRFH